jgi:hypothetical protein
MVSCLGSLRPIFEWVAGQNLADPNDDDVFYFQHLDRTILLLHIISARPSTHPLMVRTFLKVYMELGFYFVSARKIKGIIIITDLPFKSSNSFTITC